MSELHFGGTPSDGQARNDKRIKKNLTEEQKAMLYYFWEEKGDIERYCDFQAIKPILRNEYPELLKAWDDYQTSKKRLSLIIKELPYINK